MKKENFFKLITKSVCFFLEALGFLILQQFSTCKKRKIFFQTLRKNSDAFVDRLQERFL